MADDQAGEPASPLPRKKPSVWWILGGVIELFVAWFFLQLLGPNPAIVVSKETTYLTSPLRPDGLPNYEAYILEIYRRGVVPENNAAVYLAETFGLADLSSEQRAAVYSEIGISTDANQNTRLFELYSAENRNRVGEWLALRLRGASIADKADETEEGGSKTTQAALNTLPQTDDSKIYDLIGQAEKRPWKTDDVPPLAEWLVANETAFDKLLKACDRPKYYLPSPEQVDGRPDGVASIVFLPHIQLMRELARCLSVRAMWHLGENRLDEAWLNVRAIHRAAKHMWQQPTLVSGMVGIAIAGVADELTVTLVTHGNPTPELLASIQSELRNRGAVALIRDSLEVERIFLLDAVLVSMSAGPSSLFQYNLQETEGRSIGALDVVSFDSNIILRECNRWVDRVETAVKLPDRGNRVAALSQIAMELESEAERARQQTKWFAGALNRSNRSKLLASNVVHLFLSSILASQTAEDRAIRSLTMTQVAVALALFRATHDEFPASLAEVAQDLNEVLLVDETGRPFRYRCLADGFLLYCDGVNGVDDGGSIENWVFEGRPLEFMDPAEIDALRTRIPAGADDHSISVPRPQLTLPKLP